MTAAPTGSPFSGSSSTLRKRFSNLRSVLWRIDLGILPGSPSASIDDLRRVAADNRRRYASLRRRLLVDPHPAKDGDRYSDLVMDNPLSQNPESTWGRFFRNAELEKTVDQDLSRLYPEDASYFQTSACQTMLRRILLVWCLRHPEYGYRQGMHELLAPLVYVLHVDLHHLLEVRNLFEDCLDEDFDGISFPESDLVSSYISGRAKDHDLGIDKENDLCRRPIVRSLDELDPGIRDIFLLSDSYGAEGELGVILSERFMEHDAYCMFDTLMSGEHGVVAMADFFSPSAIGSSTGLPPVLEASTALYHLLFLVDSSLHSHLVELGVEPQFFALRWLRVLFGREFGLDDLLVIWDELFSFPNGTFANTDADYQYKILCSSRGAFIAAFGVSMILHLRNSLLATENPTSCLQKLSNFPNNLDMNKLVEKAKSLQGLALDSNYLSSSSQHISSKKKLTVTRGYSLPIGSPETPVNSVLDSYWEEKWRVLHRAEGLQKGTNTEIIREKTLKKLLVEKFGLTRGESLPSKIGNVGKDACSSVRRRLLDDLSHDTNPVEDQINSEPEVPAVSDDRESQSVEVNVGKQLIEESADRNIIGVESGCQAKDICLRGENSPASSPATSLHSRGNDQENDSEKSSVTSDSFADNNEETSTTEESWGQTYDKQLVEDSKVNSSIKTESQQRQEAAQKERKRLSGKFQWFWKFGRGSSEGNLEKEVTTNTKRNALSTLDGDGTYNFQEVNRNLDVEDKKVMDTMKNLGQSMLEHIQVIETVFQQDQDQSGSLKNLSKGFLGGKGQLSAMEALQELRMISNLLCEM